VAFWLWDKFAHVGNNTCTALYFRSTCPPIGSAAPGRVEMCGIDDLTLSGTTTTQYMSEKYSRRLAKSMEDFC
jgi:hypothetical protein